MLSELEKIEKELEKLTEKRNAILNEEKTRKEKEQESRKAEVTEAYNKFADLLNKYVEDYGDGYVIKTSCELG